MHSFDDVGREYDSAGNPTYHILPYERIINVLRSRAGNPTYHMLPYERIINVLRYCLQCADTR